MVNVESILQLVKDKSGVTEEKAKSLLGAILSFAQTHGVKIPSQLESYVKSAEQENKDVKGDEGTHSSDIIDSAVGFLSGLDIGGDDDKSRAGEAPAEATTASPTTGGEVDSLTELLSFLKKVGIDPQQAMAALPAVLKFLKENGIDISSITNKIPGGAAAVNAAETSSTAAPAATAEAGGEAAKSDNNDEIEEIAGDVMKKASGVFKSFGFGK